MCTNFHHDRTNNKYFYFLGGRIAVNTMSAEKSLSWKISILQLLKNRTLTVFELQDWYWDQKKRNFVLYKVIESFFQFSNSEKNYALWNLFFLGKNPPFSKKMYNSKTKMKFEKNSLLFCRAQNSASIDIRINCVSWTVRAFVSFPRYPCFSVFCE